MMTVHVMKFMKQVIQYFFFFNSAGPVRLKPSTTAVGTLPIVPLNASKSTGTRNTKNCVVEKGNLLLSG